VPPKITGELGGSDYPASRDIRCRVCSLKPYSKRSLFALCGCLAHPVCVDCLELYTLSACYQKRCIACPDCSDPIAQVDIGDCVTRRSWTGIASGWGWIDGARFGPATAVWTVIPLFVLYLSWVVLLYHAGPAYPDLLYALGLMVVCLHFGAAVFLLAKTRPLSTAYLRASVFPALLRGVAASCVFVVLTAVVGLWNLTPPSAWAPVAITDLATIVVSLIGIYYLCQTKHINPWTVGYRSVSLTHVHFLAFNQESGHFDIEVCVWNPHKEHTSYTVNKSVHV
jgi:hypothetical protein